MNPFLVCGYVGDASLADFAGEDASKLTHLNVAFGHIREHEITVGHLRNLHKLPELKKLNPALTLMLSVGGWGAGGFSEAASTAQGRTKLAESAVRVLSEHPFDGIDLDWEYPCYGEAGIHASPDDKRNFTLLLRTIREALDRKGAQEGRHYPLTIAAGADQYYVDGTEMEEVQKTLDFVQLMTYDMRGGFQTLTGHHTNLFTPSGDLYRISVDASVRMFREAGVPPRKLVIGAAFYSRMWNEVPNRHNGLHQMASSSGGYGPNYSELADDFIDKNGYTRYWDEEAMAPYLFNGDSFITYDDEQSLLAKCDYVRQQGLAGVMFWEYGCDPAHRLLDVVHQGLRRSDPYSIRQ